VTTTGGAKEETLGGLLERAAANHHSQQAIIIGDQRLSYGDLLHRTTDIARRLIGFGVKPREHVGILSPNSVEFITAFYAIAMVGAVAVPLNPRSSADELSYAVEFADIHVLLASGIGWRRYDSAHALLESAIPGLSVDGAALDTHSRPLLRAVLWLDDQTNQGFQTIDQVDAVSPVEDISGRKAAVAPDDVAMLMFTSGTEARPKAVIQTHGAMARTALARWRELMNVEPGQKVWVPTPLCHSGALLFMVGALGSGLTFVTAPYFDGHQAARTIAREEIATLWPQFPAIIQDLEFGAQELELDFTHVRHVAVYQTRACFEQSAQLFPRAAIFSGYGSTEVNAYISAPSLDSDFEHRLATCGKPFSGIEITTMDPTNGGDVGFDQVGEIVVRGTCLFSGYYKNEAATAAAFDEEGWFHTGDLGISNESRELRLVGRKKDTLKVGGINVAPAEIEARLLEHRGVRTAAVVASADRRYDEIPVAFVELQPRQPADDAPPTAAELIKFCAETLAAFKVPRHIFWIAAREWPMSLTKIDKVALRERARRELSGDAEASPPNSSNRNP